MNLEVLLRGELEEGKRGKKQGEMTGISTGNHDPDFTYKRHETFLLCA